PKGRFNLPPSCGAPMGQRPPRSVSDLRRGLCFRANPLRARRLHPLLKWRNRPPRRRRSMSHTLGGTVPSRNGNQKSFACQCREAVECVHQVGGKRRRRSEIPEDFRVSPCGFARGANAPGSEGILQTRGGWKRIAQKADAQFLLRGANNPV